MDVLTMLQLGVGQEIKGSPSAFMNWLKPTILKAEKGKISFEKWKINAEANTPLGRFGDPLEYGALVAFLASDKAYYMTGSSIAIDGGILRNIN